MGFIGSFGPLIFEVSGNKVRTFSELGETVTARWGTHEPINGLPVSEFLGAGQDEKTIKIIFSTQLGVNPDSSFQLLRAAARTGRHFPIIIGGVPLSNSDWYIESVESLSTVFSPVDGRPMWRECQIKVKEYN